MPLPRTSNPVWSGALMAAILIFSTLGSMAKPTMAGPPTAPFRILIDPHKVERTLPSWFHGVNIQGYVWDMYSNSEKTATALRNAGFAGMRFPGGISSDGYWWECPYWTPSNPNAECPGKVTDFFNGELDIWDFYTLPPIEGDSSASGAPNEAFEPYLRLVANWAGAGSYHSIGRMDTADLDSLARTAAGSRRGLLLQSNVFGTTWPNNAPSMPTGNSPSAAYAAEWAASVQGLPVSFEIGNEPEHFINNDENAGRHVPSSWRRFGSKWDWLHAYIGEFRLHAKEIRRARPGTKIYGPATNIGSSGFSTQTSNCRWGRPLPLSCQGFVDTGASKLSDGRPLGYRPALPGEVPEQTGWRVLDNWLRVTSRAPLDERPDGVSIHYYPANAACDNWPSIPTDCDIFNDGIDQGRLWSTQRSSAQSFVYHYERVQEMVQYWYGHSLPVVISEWHAGNLESKAGAPSQTASVGAALQQLDTVAMFAQLGVESHNFHSVHDVGPGKPLVWGENRAANNFGMLTGFTDQHQTHMIGRPRRPDEATATFYAMAMWGSLMGDDILESPARVSAFSEAEVSSYATKSANGHIQALIINKTSAPIDLNVSFTDLPANRYYRADATMLSPPPWIGENSVLQTPSVHLNGQAWSPSNLNLPIPLSLNGNFDGSGLKTSVPRLTAIVLDFAPTPHPDGARFRTPGQIPLYLKDSGILRHVPDVATYNRLFRDWNGVRNLQPGALPIGAPLPTATFLARESDDYKVYLVEPTVKRHVATAATMNLYNFDWNKVLVVSPGALDTYPTGNTIH